MKLLVHLTCVSQRKFSTEQFPFYLRRREPRSPMWIKNLPEHRLERDTAVDLLPSIDLCCPHSTGLHSVSVTFHNTKQHTGELGNKLVSPPPPQHPDLRMWRLLSVGLRTHQSYMTFRHRLRIEIQWDRQMRWLFFSSLWHFESWHPRL